jgi:hypothetical protein
MLAVTSDKSTLHVFDLPHASGATNGTVVTPGAAEDTSYQKWGILGKIPLLPRVFSDVYSFASAHFEMGNDYAQTYLPPLGSTLPRPSKGVIGWLDNATLVVISAGKDSRWERFVIREGEDGKRYCIREGWKRYLGS